MQQYITRSLEIDMAHRLMDEHFQCYSIHGHRVKIDLTFAFTAQKTVGFCIDFKELKRIGCQWISDNFDHGFVANPHDTAVIEACRKTSSKLYLMSLNGEGEYCNPTAENISRELFLAIRILFESYPNLKLHHIRYYETPNCWVDANENSISTDERDNFFACRLQQIKQYKKEKIL